MRGGAIQIDGRSLILTFHREMNFTEDRCNHCNVVGRGAVVHATVPHFGVTVEVMLCASCMALLTELGTGWKMTNIVRQFTLNSEQGRELRAARPKRPVGRPRKEP